jgi:CubicO group peptidase (beta-lactamase class C family)
MYKSFGKHDSASAMSKDAIFRIYSMTKPLASVAGMALEKGVIQLTDSVST